MKLRKTYNLVQNGYRYTTVHCPDTELELGQTTKLIKECKVCDDYKGILDDDSGKYVRCKWHKPTELIESRDMTTKYHINQRLMRALNSFDIHPDEFDMGLRHVKDLATKRYKEKLFKYHPDTTKVGLDKANRKLRKFRNAFDKIDKLTLSPPTSDNIDIYIELGGEL